MDLMTSRKKHPENTVISVGNTTIGDGSLCIAAGPCTIESEDQLFAVAQSVKNSGANILRGGAYKLRTSPYSFSGLGKKAIDYLVKAGELTGMAVISEICDASDLDFFDKIDIIQVGAKSMQNYPLLKALGETRKPVLLKRGGGSTIEELLYSAEYILNAGNPNVILCERGIKTFEPLTRNTFDINAIPLLKELTHLPVFADPSHGTGIASIVTSVSHGAVAAGADGLLVEVHNCPKEALCDGDQALNLPQFSLLVQGARQYEKIRCNY